VTARWSPVHAVFPSFTIDARDVPGALAREVPDGLCVTEWMNGRPQLTVRFRTADHMELTVMPLPDGWDDMATLDEMFGGEQ
jgi:hypothetical protein